MKSVRGQRCQFFGVGFLRPGHARDLAVFTRERPGRAGRAKYLAPIQVMTKSYGPANFLVG